MENIKELKTYKWFIDAYFSRSYMWDELISCINEFTEHEQQERVEKLLEEVKFIKELDDWEYIEKADINTAQIYYDESKNKEMIQIMIDNIRKYR